MFLAAVPLFFLPQLTKNAVGDLFPGNRLFGGLTLIDNVNGLLMTLEAVAIVVLLYQSLFAGRPGIRIVLSEGESFNIETQDHLQRDMLIARIKQRVTQK
ncbi:MAG: hypothetical protein AB7U82_11825 [Blastocatellales bacterium]